MAIRTLEWLQQSAPSQFLKDFIDTAYHWRDQEVQKKKVQSNAPGASVGQKVSPSQASGAVGSTTNVTQLVQQITNMTQVINNLQNQITILNAKTETFEVESFPSAETTYDIDTDGTKWTDPNKCFVWIIPNTGYKILKEVRGTEYATLTYQPGQIAVYGVKWGQDAAHLIGWVPVTITTKIGVGLANWVCDTSGIDVSGWEYIQIQYKPPQYPLTPTLALLGYKQVSQTINQYTQPGFFGYLTTIYNQTRIPDYQIGPDTSSPEWLILNWMKARFT